MRKLLIILLSTVITNSLAMEPLRKGSKRIPDEFNVAREDGSVEAACMIIDAGPFSVVARAAFLRGLFFDDTPFIDRSEVETAYFYVERDDLKKPVYWIKSTENTLTISFEFGEDGIVPAGKSTGWRRVEDPKDPRVSDDRTENAIIFALARRMRQETRKLRTRLQFGLEY